jgi:hypothetical protein
MFNSDKPINSSNEDLLGRSGFAKQLANSIDSFSESDNYTIGLYGKWGCGKTSIINMALSYIEEFNQEKTPQSGIIIIKFNPWSFTDCNQLLNQFFILLSSKLSIENPNMKKSSIGEVIESYSEALSYTKYIPVIGQYLDLLPSLTKKLGGKIKKSASEKLNDVTYRKAEVEKALLSLGRRTLIVIDDIDRLPNDQIRLVFQLVNSVAGFPFITYLLSFDKEVVVRALTEVQQCDGEQYLEKIIQVPFEVPTVNVQNVHSVLISNLNEILSQNPEAEIDNEHFSHVYSSCVNPFIQNLRDVYRLYNTLHFKYSSIKGEVDFVDLVGITTLQIFAPSIHAWIYRNKTQLTGGIPSGGVSLNKITDNKESYLNIFKAYYDKDPECMLNAISSLFPRFNNAISYTSEFISDSELKRTLRLACPSRFGLYFSLSISEVAISHARIKESIYNMPSDELTAFINEIKQGDLIGTYLDELKCHVDQIPENRTEIFIKILFELSDSLSNYSGKSLIFDPSYIANNIIMDLLHRVNDQERRFSLINNIFGNIKSSNFTAIILFLRSEEHAHGRIPESEKRGRQLLTIEQLKVLETEYVMYLSKPNEEFDLLDCTYASTVMFLWGIIEPEALLKYLKSRFDDCIGVAKYLAVAASRWSSSEKSHPWGYAFEREKLERYISIDDIVHNINKARVDSRFWNLPLNAQQTSASFMLDYLSAPSDNESSRYNEQEMNELLLTWRTEYDKNASGEHENQ